MASSNTNFLINEQLEPGILKARNGHQEMTVERQEIQRENCMKRERSRTKDERRKGAQGLFSSWSKGNGKRSIDFPRIQETFSHGYIQIMAR